MFYYVYLLENSIDKSWYTGYTANLQSRIIAHNTNGSGYTKTKAGTWSIIYAECYRNKQDALGREKFLKSGSGRKFLEMQLSHYFTKDSI